jgi:SPP1 family predicted phage head-tail adaptor
MNPGALRSRIIIQDANYVDNGFGGKITTWSTLATVWAKVDHLSGRELLIAQQISPVITYEIMIRYRSDMSTKYRIYYNGMYFNIIDIKDLDNRHEWLFLKCEVRNSEPK